MNFLNLFHLHFQSYISKENQRFVASHAKWIQIARTDKDADVKVISVAELVNQFLKVLMTYNTSSLTLILVVPGFEFNLEWYFWYIIGHKSSTPDCSKWPCVEIRQPTCGSDGKTYATRCDLQRTAACEDGKQDLVIASAGPCSGARSK